jgi:hypothetical protein
MPDNSTQTYDVDGSLDWSLGVNSLAVTTLASERNPNGLKRNELAWLVNGTVRDCGISPRNGYKYLGTIVGPASLFQGATLYQPQNANPYILIGINGHILKVDPDNVAARIDLTTINANTAMPATQPSFYFPWSQPEQFTIIQAGDFVTKPLIWDGTKLFRSTGITNPGLVGGVSGPHGVNEIPAAGPMDYMMGRLWYAQGRSYAAGDMVQNHSSGSAAYNFRDSVFQITESPLAIGGDGFTVPDGAGNIRALAHPIQINATNSQGVVFPFARRAIYAQLVPITRTLWVAADTNNQVQQTIVQLSNGAVNDRSLVAINGDLYYQTIEPGIASLNIATRYFNQPGNISLSSAENRILQFVDRSLLPFATGTYFDNRLLESSLPKQLPQGVVHDAIIPLDFLPISKFGSNFEPAWEGHHEGLQVLQLLTGDFGFERSFAIVVSALDTPAAPKGSIQLYEIQKNARFDINPNVTPANPTGEARIQWQIEFPAFTWGDEFKLKKLVGGELWIDRLYGEVLFRLEYRPDGETCWQMWHEWEVCSARNSVKRN